MKVNVYSLEGTEGKELELPKIFEEETRPDLIKRAFHALRSKIYQPKGVSEGAGMKTSADYMGRRRAYRSGAARGMARLPKVKLSGGRTGETRKVPQARTGRRAHPPKTEKILVEKINKKEKRKAIRSAIGATTKKELVAKRGHKVSKVKQLPIVVEDRLQELKKTKEIKDVLLKLNLGDELIRAEKKTIRAGRGTTRGRKYRRKKSVLFVINEDKGVAKAAKNLSGVDVYLAKELNVEALAPGGVPGRLTVYTESSIATLGNAFR